MGRVRHALAAHAALRHPGGGRRLCRGTRDARVWGRLSTEHLPASTPPLAAGPAPELGPRGPSA